LINASRKSIIRRYAQHISIDVNCITLRLLRDNYNLRLELTHVSTITTVPNCMKHRYCIHSDYGNLWRTVICISRIFRQCTAQKLIFFFDPDDLFVKLNDRALRLTFSKGWIAIVNIFLIDNNRFSARFQASDSARSS